LRPFYEGKNTSALAWVLHRETKKKEGGKKGGVVLVFGGWGGVAKKKKKEVTAMFLESAEAVDDRVNGFLYLLSLPSLPHPDDQQEKKKKERGRHLDFASPSWIHHVGQPTRSAVSLTSLLSFPTAWGKKKKERGGGRGDRVPTVLQAWTAPRKQACLASV